MKRFSMRAGLAAAMALVAVLGMAPLGHAFQSPTQGDPYAIPLREFDLGGYTSPATLQAGEAAVSALTARYGGSWHIYTFNPQTNTPSNLYGSGAQVAASLASEADVADVAQSVLLQNARTLGADPANLRPNGFPNAAGKWAAHYQQTYRGLDVWGGRVSLTFTESGRLFVMSSNYYSGIALDPTPRLSARQAEGVAQADLPFDVATDRIEAGTTLMVLPVPLTVTEVEHHLAWRVQVRTENPLGRWVTWVDAGNGKILWRYNDIDATNFTGTSTIGRQWATYCNGEAPVPNAYNRIQIAGVGETVTATNGSWTIPYTGNDPKTVTAAMVGPYVNVQNYNGAEAAFSGTATPGVPFTVAWTDANARQDERDTFNSISDIHDFFDIFDPDFNYTNAQIQAYVNRNDGYCPGNAWWDGTINFCAAGGSYANTGEIQGVVQHEFCHGITNAIIGSQGTEGIGEGNSDILANLLTRESYIGRGFYTGNCNNGIRDSENTLRYPDDVVGHEIHDAGRVIAGFNWDFQQGMMGQYGAIVGSQMAGAVWHNGRLLEHPADQRAQVLATFVGDDDDGNLDNGTPHYDYLCTAATNHGFSCPPILAGVYIVHTPIASHEQQGDVDVVARIFSYSGTLIASSLQLHYRVNGGDFIVRLLTPTGTPEQYHAIIPSLGYTSDVEYYLSASDDAGYNTTAPEGAPAVLYEFVVAPKADILAENVEAGSPDWTHSVVSGGSFVDQWHISTTRNHTTGGASSWKCGDTGAGDYANLLDAGLVTPQFELLTQSYLHFWMWIEAEESAAHPGQAYDGGLVEISVNGGPWTQIAPDEGYSHTIRTGSTPGPFPANTPVFSGTFDWRQMNFNLSQYSGTAQLRFRFGSDGADVREGWYVDDIVIDGFLLDASSADEGATGLRFALQGSRTNPTTGSAQIAFTVPSSAPVNLSVFDVSGRMVRMLTQETFGPGAHSVVWDGTDSHHSPVASGVYYCRMQSGTFTAVRPVVLSR